MAEQKTDGRVEGLYLPIVGVRNQEQFDSLCHILHSRLDEVNPRTVVLVGSIFLDLSPACFVIAAAAAGIILKNLEVRGK